MGEVERALVLVGSVVIGFIGCGGDDDAARGGSTAAPTVEVTAEAPPTPTDPTSSDTVAPTADDDASASSAAGNGDGQRCRVRLHGKSGGGGPTEEQADGVWNVFPDGNAEGWGGRQWLYFPEEEYDGAVDAVRTAIEGCEVVLLGGFSNGAAFAAKLYCAGETFEGRLVGVVVDDPVPDHAADECAPAPEVGVTLYWTEGLAETAVPGWSCAEGDWTCEGGETIGIDAFAEELGVEIQDSPMEGHSWYWDAPELSAWP